MEKTLDKLVIGEYGSVKFIGGEGRVRRRMLVSVISYSDYSNSICV